MKTIDADGRALCRLQAQAFETSLGLSCASAVFVRRFMNSDVARRMDDEGFLSESNSPEGIVAEVEVQYGRSDYGSVKLQCRGASLDGISLSVLGMRFWHVELCGL